jgi:ABC-2 type transport system permease protein
MFKLTSAIVKEMRLMFRDKAALAVMFLMPVLLVIVITSIQHSGWKMLNNKTVSLLICNRDGGDCSKQLTGALDKIGMFELLYADSTLTDKQLTDTMHAKGALIAVVIPKEYSVAMKTKAGQISGKALNEFGMQLKEPLDTTKPTELEPLTLFYNPVMEEPIRLAVQGALKSAQQFTSNRQVIEALYAGMSDKKLPEALEQEIINNKTVINQVPIAKDGSKNVPNATQHNVPAWTIFAMFFIVVALSTNIVKEKISGSFIRLKTLPTNFLLNLGGKLVTYILVTLVQVAFIFSLGIYLFPYLDLPKLVLPDSISALFVVSLVCGLSAVSYGILIGVYAKSIEQAIGFGAVSVVILAAVGGIIVPAFAMPKSLDLLMKISPLHWCMEAYNILFLQGGYSKDVLLSLVPLFVIILAMLALSVAGLRKQRLI